MSLHAWYGQYHSEPVAHSPRYDVFDNRIDIKLDDGGTSSLWWATKNEWLGLIDVAGLELEALYGSFDRGPLIDHWSTDLAATALASAPPSGG